MASQKKPTTSKPCDDGNFCNSESHNLPANLKVIFTPLENMQGGVFSFTEKYKVQYFEAPVMFNIDGHTSDILKVENAGISCGEVNESLRTRYLCVRLPKALSETLEAEAVKFYPTDLNGTNDIATHPYGTGCPIDLNQTRLRGKPGEWWRFLELFGPVGYIDKRYGSLKKFNLSKFLIDVGSGVRATLLLRIFSQAMFPLNGSEDIRPKHTLRISIVKCYVTSIDHLLLPPLHGTEGFPMPTERDIANDEFLKQLRLSERYKNLKIRPSDPNLGKNFFDPIKSHLKYTPKMGGQGGGPPTMKYPEIPTIEELLAM